MTTRNAETTVTLKSGELLRFLLKDRGIRQSALGDEMLKSNHTSLSAPGVSLLINGQNKNIAISRADAIAAALGVPITDLFDVTGAEDLRARGFTL